MRLNRADPATAALIRIGWPDGPPDEAVLLAEAEDAASSPPGAFATDWQTARAAIHAIAAVPAPGAGIDVERIECVDWSSGFEEPADPLWRIELGGYCADFPSEQAARNFAGQIALLTTRVAAPGLALRAIVAGDEEAPQAIRPLSWLEEALRELRERGPARDCEDRDAYWTMVGEVADLLAELTGALRNAPAEEGDE